MNVRTYVRVDDRPGVFFFSLDASSRAAVRVARLMLGLPYFDAAMSVRSEGDGVSYESRRVKSAADFVAREDGKVRPVVFTAVELPPKPAPPPAVWMREVAPDVV